MSDTSDKSDKSPQQADQKRNWLPIAAGVLVVALVIAILVLPALYSLSHSDQIYPGVTAAGLDLGGLTPEEAVVVAAGAALGFSDPITLVDPGFADDPEDDRTWTFERGELGLDLNGVAVADAAYRAGREATNPVASWIAPLRIRLRGVDVAPQVPIDEATARATLAELVPDVDVPPRDAEAQMEDGELVDAPPMPGRQLDVEGTLALLADLPRAPGPLTTEIATTGTAPRIGDLQSVTEAYNRIVSGPVLLRFRTGFEHEIEQELIESWVAVREVPNEAGQLIPSIVFDEAEMWAYIEPMAADIDRRAQEARYRYDMNNGTVSLRERSSTGFELDVVGTANQIIAASYTGPRVAEAAVNETRPSVTSDTISYGTEGFTELGSAATRVTGAPEGRIQNILIAADQFNGIVIPPGEELSFNEILGPVTEAEGYEMAHTGVESAAQARGGLGGGIGQVATTAFRAAFWGGFPITERRSPPFRVGWVEPPVGMDAAAGTPGTNLRFVNDTDGHLLISTELDPLRGALVWKLYGSERQRRVDALGPEVSNVTPADPSLVEQRDPRLEPGTRVQVGWAREGADATVRRTVSEDGLELFSDAFVSHYEPASDVVVEGTSE